MQQLGADNSAAVTPVGTVVADPADVNGSAMPQLDQTNPQPVRAPTLPGGNGLNAVSMSQGQPHDARSDPMAPPLYTPGVATPASSSDATTASPPGPPAAPPNRAATQQVAMHVAQSLNDGAKTVTVELHPAELGRVEIHFSFHSDGTTVRLTVDRPETFDAFSHDRSGLEQQLAQAGVDLGGGGIDLRLGQQQPDQAGGYFNGRTPRVAIPAPQPDATTATLWVSNSLLDILA
jgi:flagellar hook-length control protein FliK